MLSGATPYLQHPSFLVAEPGLQSTGSAVMGTGHCPQACGIPWIADQTRVSCTGRGGFFTSVPPGKPPCPLRMPFLSVTSFHKSLEHTQRLPTAEPVFAPMNKYCHSETEVLFFLNLLVTRLTSVLTSYVINLSMLPFPASVPHLHISSITSLLQPGVAYQTSLMVRQTNTPHPRCLLRRLICSCWFLQKIDIRY